MRLAEGLYVFGSGELGVSHQCDAHTYGVVVDESLFLVDAGSGLASKEILDNVEAEGFSPGDVAGILLTHHHWDHSGGPAELAEWTGAWVGMSAATARALPDPSRPSAAGRVAVPGEPVIVADGDVPGTGGALRALACPGHTRDSMVYLWASPVGPMLFTGDSFRGRGELATLTYDSPFQDYHQSLVAMTDLGPTGLLPGHGVPTLRHATEYLTEGLRVYESVWSSFSTGGVPMGPTWWLNRLPKQK